MSKMSKAIAALGVVAGLGVAALPLSSYAAIGDPLPTDTFTRTANADVQVEVGGAISIATSLGSTAITDPADNSLKIVELPDLMPGGLVEADADNVLNVQVTSNDSKTNKYGLYINGLGGNTDMAGTKAGASIPTLTDGAALTAGISAWGYKLDSATDYSPIPATAKKIVDTTTLDDTNSYTDKHTLTFGAAASTTQVPDTYTGHVVLTAALES